MSDTPAPKTNKIADEAADEARLAEKAEKVAKDAEKVVATAGEVAEKAEEIVETLADLPAQPRTPKEPRKGVYTLEQGDTPGKVSIKCYGRSHMAVPLARANMESDWQAGSEITLL